MVSHSTPLLCKWSVVRYSVCKIRHFPTIHRLPGGQIDHFIQSGGKMPERARSNICKTQTFESEAVSNRQAQRNTERILGSLICTTQIFSLSFITIAGDFQPEVMPSLRTPRKTPLFQSLILLYKIYKFTPTPFLPIILGHFLKKIKYVCGFYYL